MKFAEKYLDKRWKRVTAFSLVWFSVGVILFLLANTLGPIQGSGIYWNEFFGWSSLGVIAYPIVLFIFLLLDKKINLQKLNVFLFTVFSLTSTYPLWLYAYFSIVKIFY